MASPKTVLLFYVLCTGLLCKITLERKTHQLQKMVLNTVIEERTLDNKLGNHLTSSCVTLGMLFILPEGQVFVHIKAQTLNCICLMVN